MPRGSPGCQENDQTFQSIRKTRAQTREVIAPKVDLAPVDWRPSRDDAIYISSVANRFRPGKAMPDWLWPDSDSASSMAERELSRDEQ